MSKFIIEGGTRLKGKVNIGGFKNAAVAIIPATILCPGKCIIGNIPKIQDVDVFFGNIERIRSRRRLFG